jgi:putative sulfotransferase
MTMDRVAPAEPGGRAPVIVVGTGRCGSTLLSDMLRVHPEVLSVSELFSFVTDLGGLIAQAFPAQPITGAQFWRVVAGRHPRQNLLLRHGLRMQEVLYPEPGRRDLIEAGIPAVMLTTLPHLDDAPQLVFEQLEARMTSRPRAAVGDHYREMFAFLLVRAGKRIWVERSGGTLRIVARLHATFPEARFVHVVRDGRNTAISMSRHIGFRMALIGFQLLELLGVDPFEDDDRSEIDDLPDDLAALLPEHFDAKAFWDYDISPALCGHYWSGEIRDGLCVLAELPRDQTMTLRYEDLLADPVATVTGFGEFLGLGRHPEWIERAAAMVGRGRSDWRALPERARLELERACVPGFEALAAQAIHYEGCHAARHRHQAARGCDDDRDWARSSADLAP